jgi:hypothetical protein
MPVPLAARSKGVGLRPLACWECGFESHWGGRGCSYVVKFVCCHVENSATSWSLVQRSPTDCGASLCMIYKPREWGGPGPLGGCRAKKKQTINNTPNSRFLLLFENWKSHPIVKNLPLLTIICLDRWTNKWKVAQSQQLGSVKAVRERPRTEEPDFFIDNVVRFVPRWDQRITGTTVVLISP